jgi:SulP family sulfate permease
MANVVGALFQSYPVTGGFSRSAVNNDAGANTPLASIFSAVLVALTLLFLTPLFYFLPHAILASVIMLAVASLIDFSYARQLWMQNKVEFALLFATFLVTLNFSMIPGIVTGIVLSILVLLYRSAYPHIARLGRVKDHYEYRNIKRFKGLETWNHLMILRLDAPLTFVNIQYFREYIDHAVEQSNNQIETIVVDAGPISYIDATAIQGFKDLLLMLEERKIKLLLSEVVGPVRDILHETGLMNHLGSDSIFLNLNGAVESVVSQGGKRFEEYAMQHDT